MEVAEPTGWWLSESTASEVDWETGIHARGAFPRHSFSVQTLLNSGIHGPFYANMYNSKGIMSLQYDSIPIPANCSPLRSMVSMKVC
jgi:hypothetical protein